jgi:hypothetical protein
VNPDLSRTVLRSFAHFFVLVFRLHKGLETLVLASCWRYHDRVLACAGCLSQTAGLELCSFANCVCSAAWVRLSLGTASKSRKVPRKAAVFAACWYGGLFTRPVVRLQKAAGGETGRWWFGASRSKSSKGPQAPKMASNDCETQQNDAGLALRFLSHDSTLFYGQGCAVRVRRKPGSPQLPQNTPIIYPKPQYPKGRAAKMKSFTRFHPDFRRGLSGCGFRSNSQTALGAPREFRPERRGLAAERRGCGSAGGPFALSQQGAALTRPSQRTLV